MLRLLNSFGEQHQCWLLGQSGHGVISKWGIIHRWAVDNRVGPDGGQVVGDIALGSQSVLHI